MSQSGLPPLTGAVRDLAHEVVSALRGGGHLAGSTALADDELALAAVRVLGADVLLPATLAGCPLPPERVAAFRTATLAFPAAPGAAPVTAWSHWGMRRALRALGGPEEDPALPDTGEPGASWLQSLPWQRFTHQLAVLSALALPGMPSEVATTAALRPVDLARGFVRAVRRRDWLQAAGAARWLALLDGVPDTLGLDTGLDFVLLMSDDDPRVALQAHVARHIRDERLLDEGLRA
ncbi:hypothetical protein [Streptomyces sp. ICBB 8177]|uniref:hypothetical protein n=1 Tax=Streptomyces sp. ICBB 8177 TaxID=563922 RepID=UPI000D67CB3C|nr:hypothetical protein [Streptomyces sp. ICBB 8177]PWI42897.1 hypothetical protein CK485_11585 [Streptomyces sp. ICBB 8177]